jgi:hypothetical protein
VFPGLVLIKLVGYLWGDGFVNLDVSQQCCFQWKRFQLSFAKKKKMINFLTQWKCICPVKLEGKWRNLVDRLQMLVRKMHLLAGPRRGIG